MVENSQDAEIRAGSAVYETKAEASKDDEALVERWLSEIDLAKRLEKNWLAQANDARDRFRSEGKFGKQRFNIQYSNIQTMSPALYSNRPSPDVRRRFADKADKTGASRIAAQIIERNLIVSMDCYDFDGVMKSVVQNGLICGRGIPRVRHEAKEVGGYLFNKVKSEIVAWRNVTLGPADVWEDTPWICFTHHLTREALIQLNPKLGEKISLDYQVDGAKEEEAQAQPSVFKRAIVHEVWEKATGKVYWIAPGYKGGPVRVDDDPLDLIDFWPIPKPYVFSGTADTQTPVVPATIIEPLMRELEELTERIQKITRVIKWRGFADPSMDLTAFEALSDGQLAPVGENLLQLIQSGGLERHIFLMPIEQAVNVVRVLSEQRELVKQLVYEVTGISDVLRGATNPNETLGAQEIKANFGSMRVQDQQRQVQRVARDLLRLKAELMCSQFEMQELLRNAGIKLPTALDKQAAEQQMQMLQMQAQQAQEGQEPPPIPEELKRIMQEPTVEEVEAIIRDDMVRMYTIDIESDSTIQQDMRQVQGNMSAFLEGTAAFIQSIGPAVQNGFLPADAAIDLYQPFARSFHLGKQAEDALERMSDAAENQGKQPQEDQGPSPEEIEMQFKQQMFQLEAQAKQQDMQIEAQKAQIDAASDQQKSQMAAAMKQSELEHKAQLYQLEYAHKERMAELAERQALMKVQMQRAQQAERQEAAE